MFGKLFTFTQSQYLTYFVEKDHIFHIKSLNYVYLQFIFVICDSFIEFITVMDLLMCLLSQEWLPKSGFALIWGIQWRPYWIFEPPPEGAHFTAFSPLQYSLNGVPTWIFNWNGKIMTYWSFFHHYEFISAFLDNIGGAWKLSSIYGGYSNRRYTKS